MPKKFTVSYTVFVLFYNTYTFNIGIKYRLIFFSWTHCKPERERDTLRQTAERQNSSYKPQAFSYEKTKTRTPGSEQHHCYLSSLRHLFAPMFTRHTQSKASQYDVWGGQWGPRYIWLIPTVVISQTRYKPYWITAHTLASKWLDTVYSFSVTLLWCVLCRSDCILCWFSHYVLLPC